MDWSVPLFEEQNWFIGVEKKGRKISKFVDLKESNIGTILGYYYSPEVTDLFKSSLAKREDVNRIDQNFEKLVHGRLDIVLDSNVLILDWVRRNGAKNLVRHPLVESSHQIHCALSKKSPVALAKMNEVFETMKKNGDIEKILKKYRPTTALPEAT